jgi:hypothetical protein
MIHNKLKDSRLLNVPSIFVGLDQTGVFSMIDHTITIKKLQHIGFNNSAINIMKSYFKNRYQKTHFNGSDSTYKTIGNNSTFQGTKMATLIYVIYTLNQPSVIHKQCEHLYINNNECEDQLSVNYVDDNNSEVTSTSWNNIIEKKQKNISIINRNIMITIYCY